MPNKTYFTSPGFLIADLQSGLRAQIQKKMPIVNIVNALLVYQTCVKRHYAAMLMMERNTRKV